MTQEQIDNTFTYHAPFGNQAQRYEQIRNEAKQFAETLLRLTPTSGEKMLAFRHLQQAVMYANASIAINETRPE